MREEAPSGPSTGNWRTNLLLFSLTVGSVFFVGGPSFAVPFLLILLFHEFGHWIAARIHGVPASLPYFIPMPVVMFGTFGAVIVMPERIRSRNALLDIGAAGPLAGMVVAIPVLAFGLHLSEVHAMADGGYVQEGQSLLYWLVKRLVLGPMPEGHDVFLHPTALAGWSGLFITMINLLPWGQLDGGHIAFAWLGERQHHIARWIRRSLLLLFIYNLWSFLGPIWQGASPMAWPEGVSNSLFWLLWFGVTGAMARMGGGADHPPFDRGTLSPLRRAIAVGCLVLFVLLFMPTPLAFYS